MPQARVEGLPERLRAIRERFAPGASMRSFARLIGANENRYLSWESRGSAPPRATLVEAFARLRGADAEALAVWVLTGFGDEVALLGDPSHRTPPPGKLRVEHVEAAQHEREHGPGGAATMLRLLGSIAEGAEKAPEVDRARALDRINDLIKTARKAGLHLATAATLLITSAQNANAQESSANSRRQNWDFSKKKTGSARSSRRKAKVA